MLEANSTLTQPEYPRQNGMIPLPGVASRAILLTLFARNHL